MNTSLLQGVTLVVIGLVVAVASGLAELIGLGDRTDTFGWKQILGLAIGLAILLVGLVMARQGTRNP